MRFLIKNLQNKSINELRDIFLAIPRTDNCIYLQGDFHSGKDTIAKALVYLPKNISTVVFEVQYTYRRYSRDERIGTEVQQRGPYSQSYVGIYKTHIWYTKEIGESLEHYIALLPPSIDFVSFHYLEDNQNYRPIKKSSDMPILHVLRSLPPTVNHLNLNDFPFMYAYPQEIPLPAYLMVSELLKDIPDTVKYLKAKISYTNMYEMMHLNDDYKTILSSINPEVVELDLANSDLYKLSIDCFNIFFDNLPKHLKALRLDYNKLYKKPYYELSHFLSLISPTLESLSLCGNQLSTLGAMELVSILSQLSDSNLIELDIGENGLQLLEINEFEAILQNLPKTITTLRVCEIIQANHIQILPVELSARLLYLPPQIKILSFSHSSFSGFSVKDFVEVLANLLETIEGIDLSGHDLTGIVLSDLIYLFSHLPCHIKILKLNHCRLGYLEMGDLKTILTSIAPWIKELHVINNGLDRLPYWEMREVLACFPNTIKTLITGSNEFASRNDGVLVPFNSLSEVSFFKPQKRLYHQKEFARVRLIMMQLIDFRGLSLDIVLQILAYVINGHPAELSRMRRSITTLIISCKPPREITLHDQNQCISAVEQRIAKWQLHDSCLDLSRCGLNRLQNAEIRKQIYAKISAIPITTLKLRGNGFLYDDKRKKVFIEVMKDIPGNIECLDLSDNGFEYKTAGELEELFFYLPAHIKKVRLGNESPISHTLQIARHQWPESYLEFITGDTISELQQARKILNDYTKGDSAFWRFIYGHWERHHIEVVARLVRQIDDGLITNMEDLSYELGQIKLINEVGSLARRFSFLTSQQPVPERALMIGDRREDDDTIELKIGRSKII